MRIPGILELRLCFREQIMFYSSLFCLGYIGVMMSCLAMTIPGTDCLIVSLLHHHSKLPLQQVSVLSSGAAHRSSPVLATIDPFIDIHKNDSDYSLGGVLQLANSLVQTLQYIFLQRQYTCSDNVTVSTDTEITSILKPDQCYQRFGYEGSDCLATFTEEVASLGMGKVGPVVNPLNSPLMSIRPVGRKKSWKNKLRTARQHTQRQQQYQRAYTEKNTLDTNWDPLTGTHFDVSERVAEELRCELRTHLFQHQQQNHRTNDTRDTNNVENSIRKNLRPIQRNKDIYRITRIFLDPGPKKGDTGDKLAIDWWTFRADEILDAELVDSLLAYCTEACDLPLASLLLPYLLQQKILDTINQTERPDGATSKSTKFNHLWRVVLKVSCVLLQSRGVGNRQDALFEKSTLFDSIRDHAVILAQQQSLILRSEAQPLREQLLQDTRFVNQLIRTILQEGVLASFRSLQYEFLFVEGSITPRSHFLTSVHVSCSDYNETDILRKLLDQQGKPWMERALTQSLPPLTAADEEDLIAREKGDEDVVLRRWRTAMWHVLSLFSSNDTAYATGTVRCHTVFRSLDRLQGEEWSEEWLEENRDKSAGEVVDAAALAAISSNKIRGEKFVERLIDCLRFSLKHDDMIGMLLVICAVDRLTSSSADKIRTAKLNSISEVPTSHGLLWSYSPIIIAKLKNVISSS